MVKIVQDSFKELQRLQIRGSVRRAIELLDLEEFK